jgi:hypothetical protein
MTNFVHQDNFKVSFCLTACPAARLHMAIHGFVLEEDTKPAHEHHLQTAPTQTQALFTYNMTDTRPPGLTAANTLV